MARQTKTRRIISPPRSLNLHQPTHTHTPPPASTHPVWSGGGNILQTPVALHSSARRRVNSCCSRVCMLRRCVRNTRRILLLSALIYLLWAYGRVVFVYHHRSEAAAAAVVVCSTRVSARAHRRRRTMFLCGEAIAGAVDGRTTPETHTATPVVKTKERPL